MNLVALDEEEFLSLVSAALGSEHAFNTALVSYVTFHFHTAAFRILKMDMDASNSVCQREVQLWLTG